MVSELTSALNGEGDASFEEVFEKWTELNTITKKPQQKYLETSQMYSLAVNGLCTKRIISKNIWCQMLHL